MTRMHAAQVRVLYADTDQMGVVNNVHYLRYFEIGRAEWIRSSGKSYKQIETEGNLLPVVEAHLRYKESARYDDVLDIETHVEDVRAASMTFAYAIRRQGDGALLCEGWTKHACLGADNKLTRFPDELLALLRPDT
jgi:acyl-CoA thioester hydrolase